MRTSSDHSARRRAARLMAVGSASLTLIACSGGDKIVDPSTVGASGNYRWNAADSSYLVNALVGSAGSAIKGMRNIQTPDLPSYGKNAPACTATTKIGGADANNNGIPDDQTLQYVASDCKYTTNGANATVAGSLRIQDLGEIFAYRATYTNLVLTLTKGDTTVTTTVTGSIELHWASTSAATYADKSTVVIEARSSGGSASQTRAANVTAQFTPVSGTTIAANRALPTGDMTVGGTINILATTSGNAVKAGIPTSLSYTATVTSTGALTVSSGCFTEPVFSVGGILSATVSGTASGSVFLKFNGCGGTPSKS